MANASTVGFGCRQTMTVGNTPATGGQSEFLVQPLGTNVAILKGDPVANQTAQGNGTVGLQTLYMHAESGEWITNAIKSPVAESKGMNQYQSIGSAITYFRRYSLSSFVGIASEEDADAASKESPGRSPTTNKGEDEW